MEGLLNVCKKSEGCKEWRKRKGRSDVIVREQERDDAWERKGDRQCRMVVIKGQKEQ